MKNKKFIYENHFFFGPGLEPAFFITAPLAAAPFLLLAFPFPAASSAFLFIEVLDAETPDEVKKLKAKMEIKMKLKMKLKMKMKMKMEMEMKMDKEMEMKIKMVVEITSHRFCLFINHNFYDREEIIKKTN